LLSAGVQLSFQDEVREQQVEAAESNTGVALITTLDLPISPDGVHFTVNSYKEIGMRFAHAWWQLDYALAASLVRCGDVSRMVSPNPRRRAEAATTCFLSWLSQSTGAESSTLLGPTVEPTEQ
jgi:hypothetical protein